jgi:4-diphosphocytidyl-2-C-methyl-D-erythritol kinase
MRVRAFAKINLSLRVLGTRRDGFHELRTIFQSIALHDTLTIRRSRGAFLLTCDDPGCPSDETNLVCRAAQRLWSATGRDGPPRGLAIHLAKRIPMQAGLGGGSSDAAATLRALTRLWKVKPPDVRRAAAGLGADVPYFLEGGTVLGLERGDLLFPLLDYPAAWVVLALPGFGVSTKDAFAWWDAEESDRSDGPDRAHGSARANESDRSDGVVRLGKSGEWGNDLEGPVALHHPEIRRIVSGLWKAGASHAAMSGSGSAVYGLFPRRADADRAAVALATGSRRTVVARTLNRAKYQALAAY